MATTPPISFARGAPSLDIIAVDDLRAAADRAFQADPAGTFYEFRAPGAGDGAAGFLLTVEHDRSARKPGDIAYETR
jgi:hypothetical protein